MWIQHLIDITIQSHLRGDDGPVVTVRINPAGAEFTFPKHLLANRSSYFAEMFDGLSGEGNQTATLEEREGILSVQSFELLLAFLRRGKFTLPHTSIEHDISALIELARFIDMCKITGADDLIAKMLRTIIFIMSNVGPGPGVSTEANTKYLTSQHIRSAVHLPTGHPVRSVMAGASVMGYIYEKNYKFIKETHEVPSFAADLLVEVRKTFAGVKIDEYFQLYVKDPIFIDENSPRLIPYACLHSLTR